MTIKLSTEKRNQLLLVVLGLAVAAGVWYTMVYKAQTKNLADMRAARDTAEQKVQQVKRTIAAASQIEAELCDARKNLAAIEDTMASGDLYSWAINTLRQFKLGYKIDIPQYSQIDGPKDVTMLANFPYKQATITIGGSAQYYELGRFIADFENQFPYVRVLNLSIEPASGLAATEKERLSFRMEIAALVKPGTS
ncbi:MAG TPA: hypothetical protein VG167_10650 [Verrucomicrobiae bacterium]|nr:hypothetical protein [Verrucomicrobiae bacterium]